MNNKAAKNQHYVPQFLLKHFGINTKKTKRINIFDIQKDAVRYNQSISQVFSQNYFYGKGSEADIFIAEEIEAPASGVINKIVDGTFSIAENDLTVLHRFILSLFYRTPEAVERASSFMNTQLESVVSELLYLNDFNPALASSGSFDFYQDRLASILAIQGVLDAMILRDLEYHIIENETSLEFYISDHPVFMYNWLYRNLHQPGVTSITALGLQVFLPLSPRITLCLYDPKVYKYGSRGSSVTHLSNEGDIEILNSFQAINSASIIGFHLKEDEIRVKRLYKKCSHIELHRYESGILSTKEIDDGKIKSTHFVFTKQAKLRRMPSFVRIKKRSKSHAFSYQERDPALSEKLIEYKRLIHQNMRDNSANSNEEDGL